MNERQIHRHLTFNFLFWARKKRKTVNFSIIISEMRNQYSRLAFLGRGHEFSTKRRHCLRTRGEFLLLSTSYYEPEEKQIIADHLSSHIIIISEK